MAAQFVMVTMNEAGDKVVQVDGYAESIGKARTIKSVAANPFFALLLPW